MEKKGIISNPWCYLRVSLTHQKRQNIGDSSGNCLLLDWFITEDTMGKKARQLFSFSLKQTYTKVQSLLQIPNKLCRTRIWLAFCTALEFMRQEIFRE